MKQVNGLRHGNAVYFDMDLRAAWHPNANLSRALIVSFKWKVVHGSTNVIRRVSSKHA